MKLVRRGTRPKDATYAVYQGWNVWLVDDGCSGPPPSVADRNALRIPHGDRWMLPQILAGLEVIFIDDDGNLSLGYDNGDPP